VAESHNDPLLGLAPPAGLTMDEPARPRPDDYVISGPNPLVAAANPLLDLMPQIRATPSHPSPAQLREVLVDEVRQFELRAQRAGVPNETILGARYCLCTALDEAAALTPWGGNGTWSAHSLLVTFHNETWGGEKFFQLLARLSQNPGPHLALLELLYYCLQLGFEGRYRVIDNGRTQLETLRLRLLQILRKGHGEYALPLSGHWRDAPAQSQARRLPVPLWACAALAGALAFTAYLSLSWMLGAQSDAAYAAVGGLKPPAMQIVARPLPPAAPRLAVFLAPEIRESLVTVRDEADRSVVVLRGDGLFESGSTTVKNPYLPVLARIAGALNGVAGNVLISGYTDSVPMRSARFASNWQLSQARADAVKDILSQHLAQPNRVRAEGRGEADPVALNDTPANRARNRRVEITLLVAPAGVSGQQARRAAAPEEQSP
jgi:type VI secretion system protein ImpK